MFDCLVYGVLGFLFSQSLMSSENFKVSVMGPIQFEMLANMYFPLSRNSTSFLSGFEFLLYFVIMF